MKNLFRQFLSKSNSTCECENYNHLQFTRDEISQRIKENKKILRTLNSLTQADNGHRLFKCKNCNQYWQQSCAWNWDGKSYLFKVPEIEIKEWEKEQYVSPADLLIFSGVMEDYFEKNKFKESDTKCKVLECNNNSIVNGVLCKTHFVENLQKLNILPKMPDGKLFEPYR